MPTNLQTLVECPQSPNGLQFATHWYRPLGIDNFRICTCCFEENIAYSRFTSSFEPCWYTPIPGGQVCCSFNTRRAHQLFGYTSRSADLGSFQSFATRRSNPASLSRYRGHFWWQRLRTGMVFERYPTSWHASMLRRYCVGLFLWPILPTVSPAAKSR